MISHRKVHVGARSLVRGSTPLIRVSRTICGGSADRYSRAGVWRWWLAAACRVGLARGPWSLWSEPSVRQRQRGPWPDGFGWDWIRFLPYAGRRVAYAVSGSGRRWWGRPGELVPPTGLGRPSVPLVVGVGRCLHPGRYYRLGMGMSDRDVCDEDLTLDGGSGWLAADLKAGGRNRPSSGQMAGPSEAPEPVPGALSEVAGTAIPRSAATRTATTPWARAFAVLYEPFLWAGERSGLRALRAQQLSHAHGRTVEIGGGTGLNLPHYPDDLDEADPGQAGRGDAVPSGTTAERAAHGRSGGSMGPRHSRSLTLRSTPSCRPWWYRVDAPESRPPRDRPGAAPGGQLLYIEHVRSESPTLAHWQDLLAGPCRRFARGCRCNRATGELIAACGLCRARVRKAAWRGMPPMMRPLIARPSPQP